MFVVTQTIAGKKMGTLQAASIPVEYGGGNSTCMIYQLSHVGALGYFVNVTSKFKVVIC